jgi:CxxC-x17-CxxC domain-containing protein
MYKAVCDECGKSCEVPFRPSGDKPIFCSDCFEKRESGSSKRSRDSSNKELSEQVNSLNAKLDKILKLLEKLQPSSTN